MSNTIEQLSFICHTSNINSPIKASIIFKEAENHEDEEPVTRLRVGYSQEEFKKFLDCLDIEDPQEILCKRKVYGNIWYEDGSWSVKDSWCGDGWWVHNVPLPIPGELM